jgi:hypothetical protein
MTYAIAKLEGGGHALKLLNRQLTLAGQAWELKRRQAAMPPSVARESAQSGTMEPAQSTNSA